MYSVLLVDDEKIIREGVYELLSMTELDLDLAMAASAVEAISIMEERKIDIVLMDICMPQMSGLELYDVIREKWPHSKLIFLTGHLEFDYVYKVHKHARYVLKAEEDEKIVEAVRESIEEIENDLLIKRATEERTRHQINNKHYERMLFLKELVDGFTSSFLINQETLDDMDANIDLKEKVYCILLRCPTIRSLPYWKLPDVGNSIHTLVDKYILSSWNGNVFGCNKNMYYLLLQPKSLAQQANSVKILEGNCEMLQKAFMKNLNLPVSIFIAEEAVDFRQAVNDLSVICDKMASMTEDEIRIGSVAEHTEQKNQSLPETLQRELTRKVQQLDHQFDDMDRVGILNVINELCIVSRNISNMNDLFMLDLYCTVTAKVISYAKKLEFTEEDTQHIGIFQLCNLAQYTAWKEAFVNLKHVVEHVFDHVDTSIETKNEDVSNKVKSYIKDHLDGDTSLYALSGHVHLCPEHLLRVFKKQEGVTVLQYINDLKLAKARHLLVETDMQIKEIATVLGFTSAGYFGRFFKGKLGVTPNVYREQKGKLK